jgi:hypothetical protein
LCCNESGGDVIERDTGGALLSEKAWWTGGAFTSFVLFSAGKGFGVMPIIKCKGSRQVRGLDVGYVIVGLLESWVPNLVAYES